MNESRKCLGIVVGGGPAPGINSAISAATIEARNQGLKVIGIYDGFEHLVSGRTDVVRELRIEDVSRIHVQGGSILRTARANPTRSPEDMQRTVTALRALGIDCLLTIGGDDTAFASCSVAESAGGAIRVAHLPKTIDNDLPLPAGMPTFGFETARHVGTELVLTLMEDSRTTNRWFVVVAMGRKAGHLALGIGKAAGATLTIIPEEFPGDRISLDQVCKVIEAAILKRRALGHRDGLVPGPRQADRVERIQGDQRANDRGSHVNISGMALAKHAPNKANALKLMEFLASDEAQKIYANANNEYPVNPKVAPSETVQSFGMLKPDALPLENIAKYRKKASELVDKVGFDSGPAS